MLSVLHSVKLRQKQLRNICQYTADNTVFSFIIKSVVNKTVVLKYSIFIRGSLSNVNMVSTVDSLAKAIFLKV